MARARNIKPGFYKNEDLAECSIWARFLYPGLWCLADREGRLEDRPKRIKAELLPFDTQNVEPLLVELHERGFILRYAIEGKRYIQIIAFLKHQNPHHKEAASTIPKPEALPALHEAKALGNGGMEEPANPSQAQGEHGTSPIPALLIPDSLNLIPDSGFSDSRIPATAASASAKPTRQAAIALLLRNLEKERGMPTKITSMLPLVQQWVEKGVTDEQLTEAYELAVSDRTAAGERAPINAGFLDVFLAKLLNPKPAQTRVNGNGKPWYCAWQSIVAKGEETGIRLDDFETEPAFRDAVLKAHGVTLAEVEKAQRDYA